MEISVSKIFDFLFEWHSVNEFFWSVQDCFIVKLSKHNDIKLKKVIQPL